MEEFIYALLLLPYLNILHSLNSTFVVYCLDSVIHVYQTFFIKQFNTLKQSTRAEQMASSLY